MNSPSSSLGFWFYLGKKKGISKLKISLNKSDLFSVTVLNDI
jgi:hypothetical protein